MLCQKRMQMSVHLVSDKKSSFIQHLFYNTDQFEITVGAIRFLCHVQRVGRSISLCILYRVNGLNIGKDIITLRRSGFCITHLKGLYAKICNTQHRGDHMPVVIIFELFCFKAVGVCNRMFRDDLAGSKPFQNWNHFGIAPV